MQLKTDRDKVAHLLRRFALGASEAELDYYAKDGLAGAIEKLLNHEVVEEVFDLPITAMKGPNNNNIPMPAVVAHWTMRLLATRRPLLEKMTLFWHDHFATSAQKVTVSPLMYQQIETLRENALGSFSALLTHVSKDPAMLFWLDNQYNVAGKPNENFAREVMELFTLGIGHYTEKDIQEAARAFTGWTFQRRRPGPGEEEFRGASFILRDRLHDSSPKTIFGKTGNFSGEDVLQMLCENPQTARHIVQKMWAFFAYEKPEPPLVERLASGFIRTGLDIKKLVRTIMESPEFYSDKAVRRLCKSPVDFVVVTMRQLGYGELLSNAVKNQPADQAGAPPAGRLFAGSAAQAMQVMGMRLLFPPDVNGWEGGTAWITSATMVERIGWADRLFGQASAQGRRAQVRGLNSYALFEKDPRPEAVARQLASIFDSGLPESKIPELAEAAKKAAEGGAITQANANMVASKVCRLIFGSPEFQFA